LKLLFGVHGSSIGFEVGVGSIFWGGCRNGPGEGVGVLRSMVERAEGEVVVMGVAAQWVLGGGGWG